MAKRRESTSVYSPAVAELVAIGAAIGSNCEPCFKYHFSQARKLGVSKKDIAKAVAMAAAVKDAPARAILELAAKHVGTVASGEETGVPPKGTCCGESSRKSRCRPS